MWTLVKGFADALVSLWPWHTGQLVVLQIRGTIALLRVVLFCTIAWLPFVLGLLRKGCDPRVRRVKLPGAVHADVFSPYWHGQGPQTANPPVVILLPGGAWTIQNTVYDLHIAEQLMESGAIVVSVQLGNLPSTTIPQMVASLHVWLPVIQENATLAGAGPHSQRIMIGTSSGAHVAATYALISARDGTEALLDSLVLLSFPADLQKLTTIAAPAVYAWFFRSIPADAYNPTQLLDDLTPEQAQRLVPMLFVHGSEDSVTPLQPVQDFRRVLACRRSGTGGRGVSGAAAAPSFSEDDDASLIVLPNRKHADYTVEITVRGSRRDTFDIAQLLLQILPTTYELQNVWLSRAPQALPKRVADAAMSVFPF